MAARILCTQCQRPLPRCYCSLVPRLQNRWPVRILQHPSEARHALGTARIASLGLLDCQVHAGSSAEDFMAELHDCVLVYPGATSRPLPELQCGPVRPLVFLDATWRKSRRILLESPALCAMPRYHLENPPPSRYRIRREPQAGAVSTLEAIVHALETLEQSPGRYAGLLKVMDTLIEEQIRHMGPDVFRRNYLREETE